jgi:uncharacterized protein YyaL (SSP411 family)
MLAAYTGEADTHVAGITRGAARLLEQHPSAVGHLLGVLVTADAGFKEIAIVGPADQRRAFEEVVWQDYRPECVLAVGDGESSVPLLKDRGTGGATVAAHVCRNFVCDLPVTTPDALRNQLGG